jgi:hypothetical protein
MGAPFVRRLRPGVSLQSSKTSRDIASHGRRAAPEHFCRLPVRKLAHDTQVNANTLAHGELRQELRTPYWGPHIGFRAIVQTKGKGRCGDLAIGASLCPEPSSRGEAEKNGAGVAFRVDHTLIIPIASQSLYQCLLHQVFGGILAANCPGELQETRIDRSSGRDRIVPGCTLSLGRHVLMGYVHYHSIY